MGSHAKVNVGLVTSGEAAPADYNRDFYSWLMQQARHVRAGRTANSIRALSPLLAQNAQAARPCIVAASA
jgi:hypothetical protein